MQIKRQKTSVLCQKDIKHEWQLIDGENKVLGQLATDIAHILMGKHKANYTPNIDNGDYIVLVNASKIVVTGGKQDKKVYIHHSNYPGGLVRETFRSLQERDPEAIIRTAVKGMLPANRLRDARLARLKVFPDSEHTYHNFIKE